MGNLDSDRYRLINAFDVAAIATSGRWAFRYGGMDGGLLKFIIGDWGEFGEGTFGMDVWICRACGHVEFRLPHGDDPPD